MCSQHLTQPALDPTGIAIGPAQVQYALGVVIGGAQSAPDRRHRLGLRKVGQIEFPIFSGRLSFIVHHSSF